MAAVADEGILYVFGDTHISGDPKMDEKWINWHINVDIRSYINENKAKNSNFVAITGDLMNDNKKEDHTTYLKLWESSERTGYIVCDGYGNHDVTKNDNKDSDTGRYTKLSKIQADDRATRLKPYNYKVADRDGSLAPYCWSINVNGRLAHFIMLNLGTMGDDKLAIHRAGSISRSFIDKRLFRDTDKIGYDEPIFIFTHYGYDANKVHLNEKVKVKEKNDWFPDDQKSDMLWLLRDHNVAAIFSGHRHHYDYDLIIKSYESEGFIKPYPWYIAGCANGDYYTYKAKVNEEPRKYWTIMKITFNPSDNLTKGAAMYQISTISKSLPRITEHGLDELTKNPPYETADEKILSTDYF